jgi:hypothetical protein
MVVMERMEKMGEMEETAEMGLLVPFVTLLTAH